MDDKYGDMEVDESRLREADPDGLYLFMLEGYPYMMTPDQVVRWLVPKLGLLNYLYRGRPSEEGSSHEEAQMRQAL